MFGADRFKEQAKLQIDLATGKAALDAAEASLRAAAGTARCQEEGHVRPLALWKRPTSLSRNILNF